MRELIFALTGILKKSLVLAAVFLCLPAMVMAKLPVLNHILIKERPLSLEFDITGKAPVKVIRISDREVLVALKDVALARAFTVKGRNMPGLTSFNVEALEDNVVAVVIASKTPFNTINSAFNKANTRLTVSLQKPPVKQPVPVADPPAAQTSAAKPVADLKRPTVVKPARAAAGKAADPVSPARLDPVSPKAKAAPAKPKVETPEPGQAGVTRPKPVKTSPPVYVPIKRTRSEFKGDLSDICRGEDPLKGCDTKAVANALLLMKKQMYKDAYDILDRYTFQENFACLEQVYYLKAYADYMSIEDEDYARLMAAQRLFQDALVSYAQSGYVPFAYAAMGMIQSRLKNNAAAEGYFNIVAQAYPDYTGMPEVEYYLAGIYDEKGYTDKALRMYKKVFEAPVDNEYITSAGLGYGKALFDKRQYFDSLSILNYVLKNDLKKVYESPDLLKYSADANFELGLSRPARENYTRLLNLFPDIAGRDMALSRVGDAFGMENQDEKAVKIYELVREKFPETPGFINASIGLARYMKTDAEKVEIYGMIKTKFPDNSYARIAMMRLAEIYQKNGEYDKCIKEIEDLLSTHPRGLRYEAVKLMQRAYEALFKEKLKTDEYTSVLERYESEAPKLDKMDSRMISLQVGEAYLQAQLYEEAFNQLITAYKQFRRNQRPPELLLGLGVAMDESGRDDDALKLYASFSARFPKHKKKAEALTRMGQIYYEKKKIKEADTTLKKAYDASKDPFERGRILMLHANVLKENKDLKPVAALVERAVKAYGSAKGNHYDVLASSYKTLGDTYLDMTSYVRAAQAYTRALDFSEGDRAKANIGFLLGDAYQRGNLLDKAKQTFEHVAQTYDSVWARLARQRLTTMDLAEKMINS